MRKYKIAIVASLLLVSFAGADQKFDLQNGWNLVGTYIDNIPTNSFDNPSINSIWKYDGKWFAYSSNKEIAKKISSYVSSGILENLQSLKSGDGFWIQTTTGTTLKLKGNPTNNKLNIKKGWNLLSLTSDVPINTDSFKNITTVWKYDNKNQKWAVYSPVQELQSKIAQYVKNGTLETFNLINPGEGFWIYSSDENDIDLATPPSIGFVYNQIDKLNVTPLSNAKIYANGKLIDTTDATGKFLVDGLPDGTVVTVKKDGFAVAYGIVKNGQAVIMTQKNNNQKVKFYATDGNEKVAKKGIGSLNGDINMAVSNYAIKKDITVSIIPFKSAASAPALNDLNIDNENIPASNLAIVGGANINIEDNQGNLLNPDEVNGTIDFTVTQSTILGDLNSLLNGSNDQNYQTFAKKAYDQFYNMINNKMMDLVVAQFENGKWVYKGKSKLVAYDSVKKLQNGQEQISKKYKIVSDTPLKKLEPVAFLLKMNYLTGNATVCTQEGGYKMFDGSLVTTDDSNSQQFSWINEPIPNVTTIGDDSVTSAPKLTNNKGCTTISYKVPFLTPTFNLSLKKEGYYDTEVSCSIDANGSTCSNGIMYKIPDTASIEGYVYNKITNNGIDDALVTLVNPEVLSADKVKSGDTDGMSYVEVGYMPNVTYTWSAIKYDNNGKKVLEKTIKTGKGDPSYAKLNEKEIFDILVKPFDSSNSDFDAKYLTGNWDLKIKAEHKFTNDATMTEEAIGKFDIDLLMTKLASFMGGQLSEKQTEVVVDENGTQSELPKGIQTAGIYGGFSLGFLYEYGAQSDKFQWDTAIIADASDLTTKTGVICNDYDASSASKCVKDPIAEKIDTAYLNVAKGDILTYKKSLYPVGLNVKFMAKHFADLLNPDPECYNDSECKDTPLLLSGFTIRTLFNSTIEVPKTDENYNTTYETYKRYLASYADITGASSVSQMLDTPQITLVGSSATAYMRQVITKDNGYYRINMIPPSLNNGLEIFAKAEGYKFDANSDIKLVNDLSTGNVSNYNLYLDPVDVNISSQKEMPVGFEGWEFKNECNTKDVIWQIIKNPLDIQVTGDWAKTVWDENVSLLPDNNNTTSGYLWFGDTKTGMFSDTGANTSSDAVCGKAISPIIDLKNFAFPILSFDSWFEVETVDVAKDMYDQLNIGFIIPKSENNNETSVTIYNVNGDAITIDTDKYYPIDKLNPNNEPNVQDANVPYTSAGAGILPVWKNYTIPVDGLGGYKVRFVFDFNSEDDLYNGFRGWGVDSVNVTNSMSKAITLPPMIPTDASDTTGGVVSNKIR